MSYILLLEDSIINKRFLSPEIYHTRINFFNESGMEMEFEKRKKPYQIPDNAINSVDIDFCVCGFFFLMDNIPNQIPMVFTFHWMHFGLPRWC